MPEVVEGIKYWKGTTKLLLNSLKSEGSQFSCSQKIGGGSMPPWPPLFHHPWILKRLTLGPRKEKITWHCSWVCVYSVMLAWWRSPKSQLNGQFRHSLFVKVFYSEYVEKHAKMQFFVALKLLRNAKILTVGQSRIQFKGS